jgi:hypothetical protein
MVQITERTMVISGHPSNPDLNKNNNTSIVIVYFI